jgi:hypothetical protein
MNDTNTRYEEFDVAGDDLTTRVRELIHDGNVSRLFLKKESGETILEVPLTAGVAIAAAGAAFWPVLVAIGAVAALFSRVTIGVERPTEEPAVADAEGATTAG